MCGFENSFSEKRFVFSSKNGHRVNDEDLMQIYMKQIAHRDIFYGSVCVWPKICMYSLASQYYPKVYLTTPTPWLTLLLVLVKSCVNQKWC